MVRLCSHHLSFHLKKQIPMKSTQVTVYEWTLELVFANTLIHQYFDMSSKKKK